MTGVGDTTWQSTALTRYIKGVAYMARGFCGCGGGSSIIIIIIIIILLLFFLEEDITTSI